MPELAILFSIVVMILWLIIGWRAMRAHETIAEELTLFRTTPRQTVYTASQEGSQDDFQIELAEQRRRYTEFRTQHPEYDALSAKERHERFRAWLAER